MDVVHRREHEPSARGQGLYVAPHVLTYLLGLASGQHLLDVGPTAPENESIPEVPLEALGLHSGRPDVDRVEDAYSYLYEVRDRLPYAPAGEVCAP